MNIFCKLLGHTWVPATAGANPRWNTTKAGNVLVPTALDGSVRYIDRCARCGAEREARVKRDYDREPEAAPTDADAASASQSS